MNPSQSLQSKEVDVLIAEHATATEAYLHHSSLQWEIGGLLEAGVFVFWGFLLEVNSPAPLMWPVASLLICALMSIWLLYAFQLRAIYLFKLDRIIEIERLIGMEQNRRFVRAEATSIHYDYGGPRGHSLNVAIYTVAAFGAPALGWVTKGWHWGYIATLALWMWTFVHVRTNDEKVLETLNSRQSGTKTA